MSLKHKLVLTDGIDFVFCMGNDLNPITIKLVEKSRLATSDWSKLSPNPRFELLMRQFFADPSPQQCNEGTLVELVALRTKLLADDILNYAEIPYEEAMNDDERQAIELLLGMKKLVYNHNDPLLRTERVFADFIAQVIMFCLLYAHRVICQSDDIPVEKERKIRDYIMCDFLDDEALSPFRNMMAYIRDHAESSIFITQWVDECIIFLSFVQMTDFQLLNPDYHKLFELFLSKYDAQSRFDYGAYYTPRVLSEFIVSLTDKIVKQSFGGSSIFDKGNTIIDPCCGTGSFLEQVIEHDTLNEQHNICGIEILPTPYMLANYRMAVIKKKYGQKNCNINIILANTLSNYVFGVESDDSTIEGRELKKASEWSAKPIKLIIGNPPCSDSFRQNTSQDFSIINGLMDDFRPPIEERKARQNIQKQINNPYMQFIRWSCEKLLSTQNDSVLSFVVPLSFLEAESYKYARKYLMENFSELWVIAIDADGRTGVRSNSMFKTLQGRAVIILTRKCEEAKGFTDYNFIDLSHLSADAKNEFFNENIEEIKFERHIINDITKAFYPSKEFNTTLYDKFWPISTEDGRTSIFIKHCSGIKLAPTALFTHVNVAMLKRRSKEISKDGVEGARKWLSKQDRPPKDEKVIAFQSALNKYGDVKKLDEILTNNIHTYSFRPFLSSNVLLWKDLLHEYSRVGGGGTRLRPEIIASYEKRDTLGFAMAHAPKDLNPTLSQFVSFCWYYPDNDMCTRGNSHIYMNQFPGTEGGSMVSNINKELIDALVDNLRIEEKDIPATLIFYIYGIMCSQIYLDEFEGALFTVNQSEDRARVPITRDRELFLKIAEYGKELAKLERIDYIPNNILGFDYTKIKNSIPVGFKLTNISKPFDEEKEELLLSDRNQKICIKCPLSIQKLNISGYDVVKNVWLKFNSFAYTQCEFNATDMERLLNFLNTLARHEQIVSEIDAEVDKLLKQVDNFIEA